MSLPQASVVVPAGGKAAVDLRLEPALLAAGWHAGYLTATGPDDVRVTTALGAAVAPPTHTVTFAGVDRTGGSAGVPVLTLFGGGETTDHINYVPPDGTTTLEVEEDTYILTGLIEDGAPLDEQATLITDPELTVDRDMTITLDAREATPIQVRTPQPAEQRGILSYYTHRVTGEGRAIAHGVMHFSTVRKVNVSPTAPTERGSFEFSSRWQLEAPMVTAAVAGVADELEFNLLHSSPAYTGTRRWPLVSAGHGTPAELAAANVRGKAVVVEADPANVPEHQQVEAAADAGAATIAIVRDADMSAWTVWTPQGERLPIPATVVPHDDGQVLLAAARTGTSRLSLTLQTSSPYLYDVMHVEKDAVPNRIVHEVTKANSQRLEVDYAHLGGFPWTKEQRFGWRPWQTYAWNDRQRFVKTPHQRTEWVSTGDTLWQQRVHHEYFWDDSSPLLGGLAHPPRNYEAGSSTASWYRPLIRPAAPGGPGAPVSTRTAQQLSLRVPELVDADGHYGYLEGWDPDSASMTVTRDGEPIGEATSGWLDVETTAATADYVVSLGTRRISDEWAYSTRTHTEWRFRSGAPSTGSAALPMLQVDYRLGASGPAEVEFRDQTDTRGVKLRDLVVSVSTDGGTTWRQVAVRRLAANRYEFVAPRRGTGTAAVRVIAEDMSGSEVRQTVFDAYHLHP